MTETKSVKVEFTNHLPMGEKATFTVDKVLWIAYPAKKNQAIFGLVDRLIGIHNRITKDMITWINQRPQDADLVAGVLEMTSLARRLGTELIGEKAEVFTS